MNTTILLINFEKVEAHIPRSLGTLKNQRSLGRCNWLGHRGFDGEIYKKKWFVDVQAMQAWRESNGYFERDGLATVVEKWARQVTWPAVGAAS